MKLDYSTLIDVYKSHNKYLGSKSIQLENFNIKKQLTDLFCPGPNFYFIIDSPTLTIDFVSESVQEILGIKPEDLELANFIDILHPGDVQFFVKCEDLVAYFLTRIVKPNKITSYKINYCLRLKTKENSYRLFLLQIITLKVDEKGSLLKVFDSFTDISHLTTLNNYKLSIFGLDGELSYPEIDVFKENPFDDYVPFNLDAEGHPFTKREFEIINFLIKGFSTKDISNKLFISPQTVLTHRRNILKKTNAKNTLELIADLISKGFI